MSDMSDDDGNSDDVLNELDSSADERKDEKNGSLKSFKLMRMKIDKRKGRSKAKTETSTETPAPTSAKGKTEDEATTSEAVDEQKPPRTSEADKLKRPRKDAKDGNGARKKVKSKRKSKMEKEAEESKEVITPSHGRTKSKVKSKVNKVSPVGENMPQSESVLPKRNVDVLSDIGDVCRFTAFHGVPWDDHAIEAVTFRENWPELLIKAAAIGEELGVARDLKTLVAIYLGVLLIDSHFRLHPLFDFKTFFSKPELPAIRYNLAGNGDCYVMLWIHAYFLATLRGLKPVFYLGEGSWNLASLKGAYFRLSQWFKDLLPESLLDNTYTHTGELFQLEVSDDQELLAVKRDMQVRPIVYLSDETIQHGFQTNHLTEVNSFLFLVAKDNLSDNIEKLLSSRKKNVSIFSETHIKTNITKVKPINLIPPSGFYSGHLFHPIDAKECFKVKINEVNQDSNTKGALLPFPSDLFQSAINDAIISNLNSICKMQQCHFHIVLSNLHARDQGINAGLMELALWCSQNAQEWTSQYEIESKRNTDKKPFRYPSIAALAIPDASFDNEGNKTYKGIRLFLSLRLWKILKSVKGENVKSVLTSWMFTEDPQGAEANVKSFRPAKMAERAIAWLEAVVQNSRDPKPAPHNWATHDQQASVYSHGNDIFSLLLSPEFDVKSALLLVHLLHSYRVIKFESNSGILDNPKFHTRPLKLFAVGNSFRKQDGVLESKSREIQCTGLVALGEFSSAKQEDSLLRNISKAGHTWISSNFFRSSFPSENDLNPLNFLPSITISKENLSKLAVSEYDDVALQQSTKLPSIELASTNVSNIQPHKDLEQAEENMKSLAKDDMESQDDVVRDIQDSHGDSGTEAPQNPRVDEKSSSQLEKRILNGGLNKSKQASASELGEPTLENNVFVEDAKIQQESGKQIQQEEAKPHSLSTDGNEVTAPDETKRSIEECAHNQTQLKSEDPAPSLLNLNVPLKKEPRDSVIEESFKSKAYFSSTSTDVGKKASAVEQVVSKCMKDLNFLKSALSILESQLLSVELLKSVAQADTGSTVSPLVVEFEKIQILLNEISENSATLAKKCSLGIPSLPNLKKRPAEERSEPEVSKKRNSSSLLRTKCVQASLQLLEENKFVELNEITRNVSSWPSVIELLSPTQVQVKFLQDHASEIVQKVIASGLKEDHKSILFFLNKNLRKVQKEVAKK